MAFAAHNCDLINKMKKSLSIVWVFNTLILVMPCVLSFDVHMGQINSNKYENVTDTNQGPKKQAPFSIICPGEFPKEALMINEIRFLYMIEATNASVISIAKRGIIGEVAARILPCLEDDSNSRSSKIYSSRLHHGDSSGIIGFDTYPGITTFDDIICNINPESPSHCLIISDSLTIYSDKHFILPHSDVFDTIQDIVNNSTFMSSLSPFLLNSQFLRHLSPALVNEAMNTTLLSTRENRKPVATIHVVIILLSILCSILILLLLFIHKKVQSETNKDIQRSNSRCSGISTVVSYFQNSLSSRASYALAVLSPLPKAARQQEQKELPNYVIGNNNVPSHYCNISDISSLSDCYSVNSRLHKLQKIDEEHASI